MRSLSMQPWKLTALSSLSRSLAVAMYGDGSGQIAMVRLQAAQVFTLFSLIAQSKSPTLKLA